MTDPTTTRRKPGRQRLDPSLRKKAMLSFAASDTERDAKGAVVDGRTDAQAARGSGVITDHARGAFAMKPMAKAEAEKGLMWGTTPAMKKIEEDECWRFVNLSVSKSNNAAPLAEVWLRKGEGGVLKYVEVLPTFDAARKSMDAMGGNGKKNRRADDAS